jgi:hypothetical protein
VWGELPEPGAQHFWDFRQPRGEHASVAATKKRHNFARGQTYFSSDWPTGNIWQQTRPASRDSNESVALSFASAGDPAYFIDLVLFLVIEVDSKGALLVAI